MKTMKNIFGITLCSFFLVPFSFSTSFGVPLLQLYGEGSTYDSGNQTWITTKSSFTLWVMGNVNGSGGKGSIQDVFLAVAYPLNEIGTISITPTKTSLVPDPSIASSPGFVLHGDNSIPLMSDGSSLPSHGVYGLNTSWNKYLIGDFSLTDSPVADLISTFPRYPGNSWTSNSGQINAYDIAISGYSWVHFDAFDHVLGSTKSKFAPFSHDAQAVPEPTTIMLLGLGVLGLGIVARKEKNEVKT